MVVLKQFTTGQANKALVNILTAISSGLVLYCGSAKWQPLVVLAIGAIIHYLVPNAPKDPPVPPASPAEPPAGGL